MLFYNPIFVSKLENHNAHVCKMCDMQEAAHKAEGTGGDGAARDEDSLSDEVKRALNGNNVIYHYIARIVLTSCNSCNRETITRSLKVQGTQLYFFQIHCNLSPYYKSPL